MATPNSLDIPEALKYLSPELRNAILSAQNERTPYLNPEEQIDLQTTLGEIRSEYASPQAPDVGQGDVLQSPDPRASIQYEMEQKAIEEEKARAVAEEQQRTVELGRKASAEYAKVVAEKKAQLARLTGQGAFSVPEGNNALGRQFGIRDPQTGEMVSTRIPTYRQWLREQSGAVEDGGIVGNVAAVVGDYLDPLNTPIKKAFQGYNWAKDAIAGKEPTSFTGVPMADQADYEAGVSAKSNIDDKVKRDAKKKREKGETLTEEEKDILAFEDMGILDQTWEMVKGVATDEQQAREFIQGMVDLAGSSAAGGVVGDALIAAKAGQMVRMSLALGKKAKDVTRKIQMVGMNARGKKALMDGIAQLNTAQGKLRKVITKSPMAPKILEATSHLGVDAVIGGAVEWAENQSQGQTESSLAGNIVQEGLMAPLDIRTDLSVLKGLREPRPGLTPKQAAELELPASITDEEISSRVKDPEIKQKAEVQFDIQQRRKQAEAEALKAKEEMESRTPPEEFTEGSIPARTMPEEDMTPQNAMDRSEQELPPKVKNSPILRDLELPPAESKSGMPDIQPSERITQFVDEVLESPNVESRVNSYQKVEKEFVNSRMREDTRRGSEAIQDELRKSQQKGEITAELADLTNRFVQEHPDLVADLGISVAQAPKGAENTAGAYYPVEQVMAVFKNTKNPSSTGLHEVGHHLEKMIPMKYRRPILEAHAREVLSEVRKHPKFREVGELILNSGGYYHPKIELALVEYVNNTYSDPESRQKELGRLYGLINSSEFMATRMANLQKSRYQNSTAWKKAKQKLSELWEAIKEFLGMKNIHPLIQGWDSVLSGKGEKVGEMLRTPEYAWGSNKKAESVAGSKEYPEAKKPEAKKPEETVKEPVKPAGKPKVKPSEKPVKDLKKLAQEAEKAGEDKPSISEFLGDPTFMDVMAGQFISKYYALEKLQTALGIKPYSRLDLYDKMKRLPGKTGYQIEKMGRDWMEPFIEKLAKHEVDIEDMGLYVYARHAPTRNELKPSGMTDSEAFEIRKELENEYGKDELDELAEMLYSLNDVRLQALLDSGIMSQKRYDNYMKAYGREYVPLEGFLETPPSPTKGPKVLKIQKNSVSVDKAFMVAKGRSTRAENPVFKMFKQFMDDITLAQRNEALQSLIELQKEFPDMEFWSKSPIEHKPNPVTEEMENPVGDFVPDPLRNLIETNVVNVYRGGTKYGVYFNTKNPLAMQVMYGLNNPILRPEAEKIVGVLATTTRFMAATRTSLNPEFLITNVLRDLLGASFNISVEHGLKTMLETQAGIPMAMRTVYQHDRGKLVVGEWGKYMEEYSSKGGRIIGTRMRTLEDLTRKMMRLLRDQKEGKKVSPVRMARAVLDWVEVVNSSVENGIRLSYFRQRRKMGASAEQAAREARDLTIDFDERGRFGKTLSSLYMFASPAVQGAVVASRPFRNKKTRKKAFISASGMVSIAFLAAMVNRSMGGKNEETQNDHWDEVTPWAKNNKILLAVPGSPGSYITFPLPYGLGSVYALGTNLEATVSGKASVLEAAAGMLTGIAGAANPLGSNDITSLEGAAMMVSPTITDPFLEIALNRNFMDQPIMLDPRGDTEGAVPDYLKVGPRTTELSKKVASGLNRVSGGKERISGAIDVSPATLDHLASAVTGGLGSFLATFAGNIADLADKDKSLSEWAGKTVFLRKIYSPASGKGELGRVYGEDRVRDKQVQLQMEFWAGKQGDALTDGNMAKYAEYGRLLEEFKTPENLLSVAMVRVRDQVIKARAKSRKSDMKSLQLMAQEDAKAFARAYNRAEEAIHKYYKSNDKPLSEDLFEGLLIRILVQEDIVSVKNSFSKENVKLLIEETMEDAKKPALK